MTLVQRTTTPRTLQIEAGKSAAAGNVLSVSERSLQDLYQNGFPSTPQPTWPAKSLPFPATERLQPPVAAPPWWQDGVPFTEAADQHAYPAVEDKLREDAPRTPRPVENVRAQVPAFAAPGAVSATAAIPALDRLAFAGGGGGEVVYGLPPPGLPSTFPVPEGPLGTPQASPGTPQEPSRPLAPPQSLFPTTHPPLWPRLQGLLYDLYFYNDIPPSLVQQEGYSNRLAFVLFRQGRGVLLFLLALAAAFVLWLTTRQRASLRWNGYPGISYPVPGPQGYPVPAAPQGYIPPGYCYA